MAWLYTRSQTWRRIVNATNGNGFLMLGFAGAAIGIPIYLGSAVQDTTNNSKQHSALEVELRKKRSIDAQVLADAQRERLQVLFDEIKSREDGARYKAALNGESLGTHSSGTSAGAVAVNSKSSR